VDVAGGILPRLRLELIQRDDEFECAIELASQKAAQTLLGELKKFYKRRRGRISYSLGHLSAGEIESGLVVDR
jgi:hypothetical protein